MKNLARKILSVTLAAMMLFSMLPTVAFAADSGDDFYKIVHLDAGRKYFSPKSIKAMIDNAAAAGFNQVELYLSDNQGFRFALDDMKLKTDYGTYDLTPALGDGYSDGSKYPDGSGAYLTQTEMTDIIAYADKAGIEIVPCINVPGHMGAILEEFTDFRYTSGYQTSKSSIDLANEKAVAFALALTDKYAAYFADQGCKYYNVGADEYANDLSSMGFEGMGTTLYTKFVQFLNDAADIVIDYGMTPRAFNDGFYYKDYSISVEPNKAYEVCYWSSGWKGYDVASASTIANKGHKMINTNGDYYWVLGNTGWQCSASKASQFDYTVFQSGTITDPAGAMFCIWCDVGNTNGADGGTAVVKDTADVIAAFGAALPKTETVEPEEPEVPEEPVVTTPAYDAGSGITVTAEGVALDRVNVTAAAVVVDGAANVKAWDMTPYTTEGNYYTSSASVKVPVPSGWNTEKMSGFQVETDGTIKSIAGNYADGYYTFTMEHFSVGGIYDVADVAEDDVTTPDTVNKEITVTVGQTATDTISGHNYSGTYATDDSSVATVAVTGQNGSESTASYSKVNDTITFDSLISENSTTWRATDYYYKSGDNYYPLYAKRTRSWGSYTYTWGYSVDDGATVTALSDTETTRYPGYSSPSIPVYEQSGTEATPASTTVTFNGVSVGETTVKIGHVNYTINVVAENLNAVTPLTVEFWITNQHVTAGGSTSMSISASSAYSEEGVLISTIVPAEGSFDGNTMKYWKATRHPSSATQSESKDMTSATTRTDFSFIRYWEGNWAYSVDGDSWTNVASGDQIVAYYLQYTAVTDEIETLVVDWGVVPSTGYNSSNYVLIDYAVKYESGERVPSSFPVSGKTQAFHCDPADKNTVHQYNNGSSSTWSNNYRVLNMIMANETSEFEAYMITITPTSDSRTTAVADNANKATSYTYSGTEKVLWVDDEANLGAFADESLRYTNISGEVIYSVGGEPIVPGLEIFNRHGLLVTYYVRAKATEDALTVHYIDQTPVDGEFEFYSYNIAVTEGTVFDTGIALASSWKGDLTNGAVINYYGRTQTVSTDLSTLSQIGAQYLYTDYECVRVVRSDDGKHVYLYYTFNPVVQFVLDFGLPITISATDLNSSLTSGLVKDMSFSGTSATQYGVLKDNGTTVTYSPDEVLNGPDFFTLLVETSSDVNITGTAATQVAFRVYIIPASNVLYEEGFMDQSGSGASWGTGTTTGDANAQSLVNEGPYGYDSNYASSTGVSGNAYSATVSATSTITKNLTVDFRGNAFDLIGTSGPETGYVFLVITGDTTKAILIDTSHSSKTLYQVPLAHVELNEGDYTATVFGSYREAIAAAAEATGENTVAVVDSQSGEVRVVNTTEVAGAITTKAGTTVQIDGFRVYRDSSNAAFVAEEQGIQYYNILDETANFMEGESFTAYVDNVAGSYTIQNYESSGGPQNEVYLANGQSIALAVGGDATVQVSMRAVEGTATAYATDGNAVTGITIAHNTEMYYEITATNGYVTIKNVGKSLLAVCNVKIKPATTMLMTLSADDYPVLFSVLNMEPVFTPETFEAEMGVIKLFTKKVYTLTIKTSTDVERLEVNGKKVKPTNSWMVQRGLMDEYIFVVTKTASRSADVSFDVVAYDADGLASDVYIIEE